MKKSILGLNIAVLTALMLWISACDPLASQNPADSFWNKKFPKQLEWIRSQMREIPLATQEKIVQRVLQDQQRKDLIKVAVIDSGVDISHPDLLGQIDYRIANNRIVGAGYDIMGDGAFGSHVLVDPRLFAFGAKAVRQGKIVEPPESPLKILEQTNNRFSDLVLSGIQKDPLLQKSLFARLQRDTFSMFGFESIKEDPKIYLESYEQKKKDGKLINPSSPIEGDNREAVRSAQNDWVMMPDEMQAPEALKYVEFMEHGDRFIQVIVEAYNVIDKEMSFSKNLAQFQEFNTKNKEERDSSDLKEFPRELKSAMEFIILGADKYDPILRLERLFKAHPSYSGLSFSDAFRSYYATKAEQIEAALKRQDLDKETRKFLEKKKVEMFVFQNLMENIIALEKDSAAYKAMRSDLRRFVYRTKHPYIAKESSENTHATHVSGVIAKQHPNIRIVPIRVTTQSVNLDSDHKKEISSALLKDFKAFMETPYFEPLKEKVASEYGNIKVSNNTILREIAKYLEKSSLNGVFIQDVIKAVEAAGKEQAKLANVSLGTTFKKNFSLDQKVPSLTEDIFSEFARYKIGQTMQEKAPGTLFMIATGNDGAWIDGVSKTAFPVSITSSRLATITKEKGLAPSPNNSLKNVLAVASINPNGTLTPFSNILLDANTPQIFSTGEEIMAPVPGKSIGTATKIADKKIGELTKLLVKLMVVEGTADRPKNVNSKHDIYKGMRDMNLNLSFTTQLSESIATLLHIQNPENRKSMSGTSMATPTVTGIIARYLAEKITAEKISSDKIYMHPSLSPEKIVSEIMAMSRTNSLTPMFTVKMLVDNIKTWKQAKAVTAQKKHMNSLLKTRCETIFSAM